ncbi:MAG: hypothetical protein ICV72_06535 [Aldersonia sp.]|nr:hypothetical protein [Aldersonia sp.]
MRRWKLLTAHAAVVVALSIAVLVLALATADESNDPNIGLGLLMLPLLALGLPWSVFFIRDPYRFDGVPGAVLFVVALAPAFLNVVLHVVFAAWWRRRRATSRTN